MGRAYSSFPMKSFSTFNMSHVSPELKDQKDKLSTYFAENMVENKMQQPSTL